jgi:nucleoside triphosphate diphosphatase
VPRCSELHEVDAALSATGPGPAASNAALAEEFGDLLFSIVNWGRHLGVDAEQALRSANGKFERRFERMEELARERALDLARLSAAQWDALWREAKLNAS